MLQDFLQENCISHPVATCHLRTFSQRFLESLPPHERPNWPRSAIVSELSAAGYPTAVDHTKTSVIVGLALPTKIENGRLVCA